MWWGVIWNALYKPLSHCVTAPLRGEPRGRVPCTPVGLMGSFAALRMSAWGRIRTAVVAHPPTPLLGRGHDAAARTAFKGGMRGGEYSYKRIKSLGEDFLMYKLYLYLLQKFLILLWNFGGTIRLCFTIGYDIIKAFLYQYMHFYAKSKEFFV